MERRDMALENFMGGYRCSQAVFSAFARDFDLDFDLANKLSICLAGGTGIGGECGAVSSAYLVIGLRYGFAEPGKPDAFKLVLEKTKTFINRFKSLHGNINCPSLIGLDVFSESGHQKFMENNIKEKKCTRFVSSTVEILESLFEE